MIKTGSWVPVFYVMVACDIVAAFMALFWLKPYARKTLQKAAEMQRQQEAAAVKPKKPEGVLV